MGIYYSDFSVWEKEDYSSLTEACLRADTIIRKELETSFPKVYILSEASASAGKKIGGMVTDMDGITLDYGLDWPLLNLYFVATGERCVLTLLSLEGCY